MTHRNEAPLPRVLHQDADLLVIDKPPGLLAVPGRGGESVVDALRQAGVTEARAELLVVHRLDRDASGVMVLARTPEAHRALCDQFEHRAVDKVYLAVVRGALSGDGRIDLALRPNASNTRVDIAATDDCGKPSVTLWRAVEALSGHTLVECRPLTGRLHQIRAHLAAIGHPLAVDPLYGGADAVFLSDFKRGYKASGRRTEKPLIDRLTLHAWKLTFAHPTRGEPLTMEAPLPDDLRRVIRQLGKYGP